MKLNIRPPKLIGLLAVIVLLALTSVTSVWAQERFSTLTGTVKDPSGSVVPDAKVSAENVNTKRVLETKTAGNGEFRIMNAEAGRYTVRFEKVGFATTRVDDVLLVVGKATSVNPSIQVGTAAESVTVVENAGLIDFSTTKIANNISAEDFDRLPKGRSFQSLALTSASVNSGEVEGGFQVNGASGGENQFNIDGVSTTSLINGKSRQNALFEILQEVQVKTSGLDAEYGGAMGGVISAVTKSGGNAFHGEGHYYFSGNAIGAGPVKRLVLNQSTEKDVSYFQDGKFKDNNHEIGGSVGGPILKNRMYFFTLFSPRFRSRSNDYLFSNGTQPGTIDQDQTYHAWFNKLSYDVHPKLRTNFTYLWTPTRSTGNLLGYAGYGNNFSTQTLAGAAPNKTIGWSQPQTSYTGQGIGLRPQPH